MSDQPEPGQEPFPPEEASGQVFPPNGTQQEPAPSAMGGESPHIQDVPPAPTPEGEQSPPPPEPEQPAAAASEPTGHRRGNRIELSYVGGDLTILGGAEQVTVRGARYPSPQPDADGVLRVAGLPDSAELRVPDGYVVEAHEIAGDLHASRFDGLLRIERVEGDVTLDAVAGARLSWVEGDLRARHGAELELRGIDGDARIDEFSLPPVLGRVSGDLVARNLSGLEVRDSIDGDLQVERCGPVLVRDTISGDVRANGIDGAFQCGEVGGDCALNQVRDVIVSTVGGDLMVEHAAGVVEAGTVGGDARIRDASGRIRLGSIGGDLDVAQAPGGLLAGLIGGDAVLETSLQHPAEFIVQASGDIRLRARGEVHARFVAQTSGGEIRTRLPLTVERGRRRNLVGVLGRGDATVTLQSSGGDISITASDMYERENTMGDESTTEEQQQHTPNGDTERTWEGAFGGRRFRIRVDRGPGRAGVRFQGPFGPDEEPASDRDFGFEWERGRGARTYGEYEARMNEIRDKAERVARRAAEQAQRAAEQAAQRVRETDWESMGREIRGNIERAMGDLEDTFAQMRREWDVRRPGTPNGGSGPSTSQRVRIEHDDEPAAGPSASASTADAADMMNADERDAQRRAILERLRTGEISIDEAERQLNSLH